MMSPLCYPIKNRASAHRLLMVGNFLSGSGFSTSVGESLALKLTSAGYQVLTTSSKPGRFTRLADMLLSVWRWRNQYGLAHVELFSGNAFIWAEAVCALLRFVAKPYIISLHGGNLPVFSRKHPGRVGRLLTSAAVVTAPSHYLRKELQTFRSDIIYIPNGIDITPYQFKLRTNPIPSVVWLRAFHKIYNPQMAIDMVKRLINEFPSINLQMFGPDRDGSLESTKKLANEVGVAGQILFPGQINKSEVPVRVNSGDIFINTTTTDNTPVSVIEAMACGLCVVSTDVGGIPHLLENEVDALLVPSGDSDAMAAAVRRILSEPGLAERLSRNARAKVEQFDWSVVLPKWGALF